MSLRLQLLAFGLLTLILPAIGFRYIREMEEALRSGLEGSLLASATTVAAALADQPALLCGTGACAPSRATSAHDGAARTIYAHPLAAEPRIDGGRDDWNVAAEAGLVLADGHRVWAGVNGRYAFLFVAATDTELVYQGVPGQPPYGDRVVVVAEPEPGRLRWLLLATAAPGAFRAQETSPIRFEASGSHDDRIVGAWQETATGYSVEARVPLNLVGAALAVAVIDVDPRGGEYAVALSSSWDATTSAPGRFVYQHADLQSLVRQFSRAGGRFRVLDADGWILSDAGGLDVGKVDRDSADLLASLFRLALRRDDPPYPQEQPAGRIADATLRGALEGKAAAVWYGSAPDQDAIVSAAVPIQSGQGIVGAVLFEQASDPILTLTNRALVRFMTFTLLASIVAAFGLLGYATWLSLRVRSLARAAETALGPKGEIHAAMPGSHARDELGDLARSFADVLARLREHTGYLRTLASKLSHELRTPLAVVTTSLDNLEHETHSPTAGEYLGRLRQGAARLDGILAAMSEATQLEQAIEETAAERFDLAAVVESCCEAYRDVYPERVVACRITARDAHIVGSGELIAQLLDKLVDNAASFSAPGSRVDVALEASADELELSVTNRGPPLPAKMRRELFDSLVSIRDGSDGRPHLGLGLHIVALIAKFHRGRAAAMDLPDATGVVFKVWFPHGRA